MNNPPDTSLLLKFISATDDEAALDALQLDARHRLKLALPVIPFLLSYEGEIDLGSHTTLADLREALTRRVRPTS
jgi:hypothetical protein